MEHIDCVSEEALILCKSQCLPALFFFKCCAIVCDTQDSLRGFVDFSGSMVVFSIPTPCKPADRVQSTDVPRLDAPNWTIVI